MKRLFVVCLSIITVHAFAVLPIVKDGKRGTVLVDGGVVGGGGRHQIGTESVYFVQDFDNTVELELDFFQDNYGVENWPVGYVTLRGLNDSILPFRLVPVVGAKIDFHLYPNIGVERELELFDGNLAIAYVRNYFDNSGGERSFADLGIDSFVQTGRFYLTPGIAYNHAWGNGSGVVIPRASIGYVINKSVSVYVDSSITLGKRQPFARVTTGLKFNY